MSLKLPLTGIDQLDQQHLRLVKLIDQLLALIPQSPADKELLDILSQLFQFSAEHFSTEEGYLKMAGYPDIVKHIEEHRFFENELKGWVQKCLAGQLDAATLHAILVEWFKTHIGVSDMEYVPFLSKTSV